MSAGDAERRETRIAGTWVGLVLAAIVTLAIVGVADWLVLWGHSSTCREAPDPDEARAGRVWLGGVFLVSATPWALGAAMSRHRVPIAVVGAFAVVPGLLLFLYGLSTDAWVGSFCF